VIVVVPALGAGGPRFKSGRPDLVSLGLIVSCDDGAFSSLRCWSSFGRASHRLSIHPPAAATSFSGRCFLSIAHLRLYACQRLPSNLGSLAFFSATVSHSEPVTVNHPVARVRSCENEGNTLAQ
jgi:hypothetical protein